MGNFSCIPKSSKDLDKIDSLGSISKDDITKQLRLKKTKQSLKPINTDIKNNIR